MARNREFQNDQDYDSIKERWFLAWKKSRWRREHRDTNIKMTEKGIDKKKSTWREVHRDTKHQEQTVSQEINLDIKGLDMTLKPSTRPLIINAIGLVDENWSYKRWRN
jgi:hypothetical protein